MADSDAELRRHPFQAGGIVGPEYFWDREEERRRIREIYASGTIAVLSGARRMGKTSLAEIVGREMVEAKQLNWAMLSVRETTPANFAPKLLAAVFHLREGHRVKNLVQQALEFARSVRLQPVVEADPARGGISFNIDAQRARAEADDAAVYHDILDALEKVPAENKRNAALVLDEFQDIAKSAPIFSEVLKSRARSGRGLAILLMGSTQHLMNELVNSPSAPLYRIGLQVSLGPLPIEAVQDEVQRRLGWNGITIRPDVVQELFDLCGGVTQDIQLLCMNLLEEALRHKWDEISSERLQRVARDVVEQNLDRFVDKWNQLTAIQREVLVAVAQYGGSRVFSAEFLRRIDPARPPLPATVRRSLLAMVDKEILETAHPEGYRFKDALFAYYVRHLVAESSARP